MIYWKLAQLVDLNHQVLCSDSANRMTSLAGFGFKMAEDHVNIKLLTALFVIMLTHYLFVEICDLKQINFRHILLGWQKNIISYVALKTGLNLP